MPVPKMDVEPLISIIMPAHNAAAFISEAIASVQVQTWRNRELIVVDNGSTDGTADIVRSMAGPQVTLLHEPRRGVGHARNKGLARMRGELYCFLDADDRMPPRSLELRAALLLADPGVHFADGALHAFGPDGRTLWTRTPHHAGDPMPALLAFDGGCFNGLTWMVRRVPGPVPLFRTDMTHAEDLLYCITVAPQGRYAHVKEPVLHYRVGHPSAMSDLKGQQRGYRQLVRHVRALPNAPTPEVLDRAWRRMRRIMVRSYLKRGRPLAALRAWAGPPPR